MSLFVWRNWLLPILSLFAIMLHFAIGWLDLPPVGQVKASDVPLLLLIIIGGIPLVLQILRKLLSGDFGADSLAVLAFVTGIALSQFLAATLIILMLAGGQALESYAMRKASFVLRALAKRMPSVVHRKKDKIIEEIPLNKVAIGDEIIVFPHEVTPVDGVVISGNSTMDESYITGEPYYVSKTIGSSILSGAINGEAVLTLRTEKLPNDSRYAQIMRVMQDAQQKHPAMRRLGDQIGAVFAPIALLFALIAWYFSGDSIRFLAVLVVATPCPLLIAIPVTLISAISMAAKCGIIIKDPIVLERLPTCRTAIFDKTGTLTYGKPELTEIIAAVSNITENEILQYTASLERYSKHPLATAILQAASQKKLLTIPATDVSEKPGLGLTGMVNGRKIWLTNRKNLLEILPATANQLPSTEAGLECVVMIDEQYAGIFRFRDMPRLDGKSFISHLEPFHQFNKIMLVSGDRPSEVAYLANLLGIKETRASQSPEDKVKIIRAETMKAPTLFIGDGINDAPGLATATVGIAFGQNSSVTAEASGAVILENKLTKVDELIHLSVDMRKIMLQSAIGGMGLSIICMFFAAGGFITPVMGSLLQEGIDVLAIVNALRMTLCNKIETDFNKFDK